MDSAAEAIDIINRQLRQEKQKLKGFVVGKKFISTPMFSLSTFNNLISAPTHPQEYLQKQSRSCRKLFEELVNKDLAIYEEMRLRDLLLCRAQAPGFSVREADFADVWERRLVELLERRRSYLNQMSDVWEKLTSSICDVAGVLRAELQEQDRLMELFDKQRNGSAAMDNSLRAAQEQRSVALRARTATLQVTFPPFGPVSLFRNFNYRGR